MSKQKLCLACSVGGHLTQMRQLEEFYSQYDYFYITEDTLLSREMEKNNRMYFVRLVNRKMKLFPLYMLRNAFKIWRILRRERPDVVISTGALNAVPVCYLAKWMGIRVVFIESYAKLHQPTLSGRLVSRVADLFIVQWETMLRHYPKAVYGGSIY